MSAILDIVRSAIFAARGEGLMSKAKQVVTKGTMPSERARQTLSNSSAAQFGVHRVSIHRIEADGVRVFYRAGGSFAAWIPGLIVHVSGTHSPSRRSLLRDRSGPPWFRVYGGSGRTKIYVLVQCIGGN